MVQPATFGCIVYLFLHQPQVFFRISTCNRTWDRKGSCRCHRKREPLEAWCQSRDGTAQVDQVSIIPTLVGSWGDHILHQTCLGDCDEGRGWESIGVVDESEVDDAQILSGLAGIHRIKSRDMVTPILLEQIDKYETFILYHDDLKLKIKWSFPTQDKMHRLPIIY